MQMPTEADWRGHDLDLDLQYGYKHFGRKDLQAVSKLYAETSLGRAEDLLFMPLACFRYYFHAVISYLFSDESNGDFPGVDQFCKLSGYA